jgi:hypothetical protein
MDMLGQLTAFFTHSAKMSATTRMCFSRAALTFQLLCGISHWANSPIGFVAKEARSPGFWCRLRIAVYSIFQRMYIKLFVKTSFPVESTQLHLLHRLGQFRVFAQSQGVEVYFAGQQATIPNH